MKKSLVTLLLVAASCLSPLVAAAGDKPLAKPDILNEETVSTTERLGTYDTIVIKETTCEGVAYENINAEEQPRVDVMKSMLTKNFSESLAAELKLRKMFKNVVQEGKPAGKAVIIETAYTKFNGGNRALRFWVGFGAGKTSLTMKGRILDAATGQELATFEDQETGYKGAFSMENFADLFPHQAKGLGENVAKFIEKLY